MSSTAQFSLPLLQANQAQKHITVNEALSLLDVFAQFRIKDLDVSTPPLNAIDGDCFLIGSGATGEWFARDGELAVNSNGGWLFVVPLKGWHAYVEQTQTAYVYDGQTWIPGTGVVSSFGSSTVSYIQEFEFQTSGAGSFTAVEPIPQNCKVDAISLMVDTELTTDGETSWRCGTTANSTEFGTNLSLNAGAQSVLDGSPTLQTGSDFLTVSIASGQFLSGQVRVALHLTQYRAPS